MLQWKTLLPWNDDVDVILPRASFDKLYRKIREHGDYTRKRVRVSGLFTWLPLCVKPHEKRGCAIEIGWPSDHKYDVLKMREIGAGVDLPGSVPIGTLDLITTLQGGVTRRENDILALKQSVPPFFPAPAGLENASSIVFGGVATHMVPVAHMHRYLDAQYQHWQFRRFPSFWSHRPSIARCRGQLTLVSLKKT